MQDDVEMTMRGDGDTAARGIKPISEFHLLPAAQRRQDLESDRFVPTRQKDSVQKFENRSFLFSDTVLNSTSSAFEIGCTKAEKSQIVISKDEKSATEDEPENSSSSDKLYETLIASVLFEAKNPHTIKGGALNDFSTEEEIERFGRVQAPSSALKTLKFSKTHLKSTCQL